MSLALVAKLRVDGTFVPDRALIPVRVHASLLLSAHGRLPRLSWIGACRILFSFHGTIVTALRKKVTTRINRRGSSDQRTAYFRESAGVMGSGQNRIAHPFQDTLFTRS